VAVAARLKAAVDNGSPSLAALAAADAEEAERRDPAALRRRLEEAESIEAVLKVIGEVTALVTALKVAKADAVDINKAAEVLTRGERRCGLSLAEMARRREVGQVRDHGRRRTFASLGVSTKMRERMKARAAVPEAEFEARLAAKAAAVAVGKKQAPPAERVKMLLSPWTRDELGNASRTLTCVDAAEAAVEVPDPARRGGV
jgi:hypothetical protein